MHLTAFPSRLSKLSIASLMVCAAASAFAQVRPDAGQTQREVQPTAPIRPAPAAAPISVQTPQPAPGANSTVPITPTAFSYTGNTLFSAAELDALINVGLGKSQTLSQINILLGNITTFYRSKGYVFARAYLPPQDIKDGKILVAIVEGKHGTTLLTNTSGVRSSVIESVLAPLSGGQVINEATLQRQMLLLQDLPGIQPSAAIFPGAQVGTADLGVVVNPGSKIYGSAEVDNYGGAFTGRSRLSVGLGINNIAGLGDVLNLRGSTSGEGLSYARVAYQLPIGGSGLNVGINFSTLRYELSGKFAALDANGKANSNGLSASYPIIRSPKQNMRFGLTYDHKTSQDRLDSLLDVSDKTNKLWMMSLSGDIRDGSGITGYSLAYGSGKLALDAAHIAGDLSTARTAGSYSKINLGVQRVQALSPSTELQINFSAQIPGKNLTSAEKMSVGGPGGVRAYATSEAPGDRGQLLNLELRRAFNANWQASAFLDAAQTTTNHTLWAGALTPGQSNKRSLAGAGIGVQWSDAKNLRVKAQLATRLGNEAATSDKDSRSRIWLQASIAF